MADGIVEVTPFVLRGGPHDGWSDRWAGRTPPQVIWMWPSREPPHVPIVDEPIAIRHPVPTLEYRDTGRFDTDGRRIYAFAGNAVDATDREAAPTSVPPAFLSNLDALLDEAGAREAERMGLDPAAPPPDSPPSPRLPVRDLIAPFPADPERFVDLLKRYLFLESGKTEEEASVLVQKYPKIVARGIRRGAYFVGAIAMALEMAEARRGDGGPGETVP